MFIMSLSLFREPRNVIVTRWIRLTRLVCAPYRPELHYMRGPGPKWHAKHRGRTGHDAL